MLEFFLSYFSPSKMLQKNAFCKQPCVSVVVPLRMVGRVTSINPVPTSSMPVPTRDAQSLEGYHRSTSGHPKSSTMEFQPLQPISQLQWRPTLNDSTQTQVAYGISRVKRCAPLSYWHHEMWWNDLCDWSVGMEGYRLFRKDMKRRQGECTTLCVSDHLEWMDLHLWMDKKQIKSFWVRINRREGIGDIIVGVYYRPPDQ